MSPYAFSKNVSASTFPRDQASWYDATKANAFSSVVGKWASVVCGVAGTTVGATLDAAADSDKSARLPHVTL
ncbi:hypothetical protein AGR6A_Lc80014 [Agrobacterium sp. NCPPB 925]|nr:hypothetical protein AGR6A_Lc80014 [Agrobacterium sp. NCPPB 925]